MFPLVWQSRVYVSFLFIWIWHRLRCVCVCVFIRSFRATLNPPKHTLSSAVAMLCKTSSPCFRVSVRTHTHTQSLPIMLHYVTPSDRSWKKDLSLSLSLPYLVTIPRLISVSKPFFHFTEHTHTNFHSASMCSHNRCCTECHVKACRAFAAVNESCLMWVSGSVWCITIR